MKHWERAWYDLEFWKNHSRCCDGVCWRGTGRKEKSLSQQSRQVNTVLVQETRQWKYESIHVEDTILVTREHTRWRTIQRFLVWERLFGSFLSNLFCLFYPLTEGKLIKSHQWCLLLSAFQSTFQQNFTSYSIFQVRIVGFSSDNKRLWFMREFKIFK